MKKPVHNSISILENSYSFINESIRYYRRTKRNNKLWPFTIFLLIQGLELLMKYVLKLEHPILIYKNVDKPKNTVSISQALERLISISNIKIDDKEKRLINKAINYRNQTLHYELSYNRFELKSTFVQLFEFVHYFHKKHLDKDLHDFIEKSLWANEAELMNNFKERFVHYHGVEVDKSTPLEIVKIQKYNGLQLNGEYFLRIPYGKEEFEWSSNPCHDCGCLKGQYHLEFCDVEECPSCGRQFLSCECGGEDVFYVHVEDTEEDKIEKNDKTEII